MPNLEQPKQKTLESIPSPAEAKEILGSYKKLGDKMIQVDKYLQTIEDKLQNDTTLRKDEKVELEQIFNEIESQKKTIVAQMNTPAAQIDAINDKLRELEGKMMSSEFRKDEKDVLNTEFNTLEEKKKDLLNTPKEESVPDIKNVTIQPISESTPATPIIAPATPATASPTNPTAAQAESAPVSTPTAPENPPAEPVESSVPPVQKTQAELLAEKIRNLDKTGDVLTPEDFEFRTKHWPEVSEALMKLSQPTTINEENILEQGTPSLEWITSSYGDMLFKNKDVIRKGFDHADPLMRDSLKKLSEQYHELHFAEVQKIHESGGSIADQMAFYKQQSEKLALEVMRRETEATKARVSKTVSKTISAAGAGLLYLAVFGAKAARATWEKGKDLAGRGLDKAQELWNAPASKPKTLKERLMEKFQMNTEKPEGSSDASKSEKKESNPLAKKFGKTNQDRIAQRTEFQKTMRELEEKRVLEKNTKEAIEKIIGKPLDGVVKTKWERLGKISIEGFFNPITKLGKKLEDYPEDARTIYEKIIPIYQKDLASDPKMTLRDYITQLVKERAI
jgi:hypothetical protein